MPILLAKLFMKLEPMSVVAKTMTKATVVINYEFDVSIWRQSAKAMTPWIISKSYLS